MNKDNLTELGSSRGNFLSAKKAVKHHGPKSEHPAPKAGSLAWKIRQKRREEGLNTDQLGEKVGVSGVSITKIETGQTKIGKDHERSKWTVIKIARFFNWDFEEDWLSVELGEAIPQKGSKGR